jgi:hypothetical protein
MRPNWMTDDNTEVTYRREISRGTSEVHEVCLFIAKLIFLSSMISGAEGYYTQGPLFDIEYCKKGDSHLWPRRREE